MSRRSLGISLVVLALTPATLLWRPLFGGHALSGGDIVNQYIPYKSLIVEEIRAGEFPHWNPLTFSGRPLQADIQVGVFYPPNAVFLIADPAQAFDWMAWAHLAWGAWGALLFFRRTLRDGVAALIAASVFAFSGFFATQLLSGIVLFIFTGAWLPWMLLAAEIGVRERRAGGWIALAVCGALQLLAGSPQIAFYSWILISLYVAVGVVALRRADGGADDGKRLFGIAAPGWAALAGFGAGAALAAGLTAAQWAPTREYLALSFDRGAGASWEFVTDGSLRAPWLAMFVAPFLFQHPANDDPTQPNHYWGSPVNGVPVGYWEFNGFAGVLALALAAAGLAALRRRRSVDERRLALFAVACVALWLVFAPGKFSPLFRLAFWTIPGFDRFRVPARWVLSYQMGLAALAGLGWLRVRDVNARRARGAALATLAALAAAGLAAVAFRQPLIRLFLDWSGLAETLRAQGATEFQIAAMTADLVRRNGPAFMAAGLRLGLVAVALLALGAVLWRRAPGRAAGCAAAAAVLIEVGAFASSLVRSAPVEAFAQSKEFYAQSEARDALAALLRPGERWTWDDSVFEWTVDQNQLELFPNKPILYNLPTARGYDPINSRRYGQYFNAAAGLPLDEPPRAFMFMGDAAHPRLLSLLNVRGFLSYRTDLSERTDRTYGTDKTNGTYGTEDRVEIQLARAFPSGLRLYELTDAMGVAYLARPVLVDVLDEHSRAEAVFTALLAPEFDWRNEAVVEGEGGSKVEGRGLRVEESGLAIGDGVGEAQVVEAGYGRFRLRVAATEAAVVVLSQSYYPGWRAEVNGEPQPAIPVNWALTGVLVEPGEHEVEFYYLPAAFAWGWKVSLISLGLLSIAVLAFLIWMNKSFARRIERD